VSNSESLCEVIIKTSRAIKMYANKEFVRQRASVNYGQYAMLKKISENKVKRLTDLANLMQMDRTTLTRNLRWLDAKGLTERIHAQIGRRRISVKMTPLGEKTLSQYSDLFESVNSSISDAFMESEAIKVKLIELIENKM